MKLISACLLMLFPMASLTACSATRVVAGEVVKRELVCTDELACKTALAKDCPKGGQLHGVTPAIVVEYSCNPVM